MPDSAAPAPPAPTAAPPADDLVLTRHQITVPGGRLDYTVTAGRVVLREERHTDGKFEGHKPVAEMFMVSYILDGARAEERPVTFAFNGGPGSSSVWLHLGLLGPRRVDMGDAGALNPPPARLVDNPETLLAVSDLVFIDPVSTGFSRASEGEDPSGFHGYQRDLESVGELIRLWTSRYGRWLSPKYLAGESYGTVRASALAGHLSQRYGMNLNGIALISSVLDFATVDFHDGNDLPAAMYLPTYACLAHYHGRLGGGVSLAEVRRAAEQLASRDYPAALAAGSRLTAAERETVCSQLSALTGLAVPYLERADLRVECNRFFRELRRDEQLVIGRLDGRFTGWEADDVGERPSYDPSYSAIHGPYAAALNHYVRVDLDYPSDLPYEVLTDRVQPWSYRDFEGRPVTVAAQLAEAMRHNPALRVHVACGLYDGATPYFAAEHVLAHLALPPELRSNIEVRYYPAGHMMYVHEPSRLAQSADLRAFVTG